MIVNPASGRGRGGRLLPSVRAAFARHGVDDVRVTSRPGEEGALAAAAADDGIETIVAVGGDGTWSNAANGLLSAGGGTRMAFLAAGTGNDFAKSLGLPANDIAATAAIAVGTRTREIDVGRVNDRHFLNSCGFGFDAAVLDHAARIRWLRGSAVYMYSALRQLFSYRGVEIDVALSPGARTTGELMMLIAANAAHLGGAFIIAPGASVDDGLLDVVRVQDAGSLGRLRLFIAATKGKHLAFPNVVVERAQSVSLRFATPPACQRDGERDILQSRDVAISCIPRALRVAVP